MSGRRQRARTMITTLRPATALVSWIEAEHAVLHSSANPAGPVSPLAWQLSTARDHQSAEAGTIRHDTGPVVLHDTQDALWQTFMWWTPRCKASGQPGSPAQQAHYSAPVRLMRGRIRWRRSERGG